MTRIILDEALRDKLHGLSRPLEFCDEGGRVLGRFTPTAPSGTGGTEPALSEEELQRREQEPEYSTAEVLAFLEKL